MIKYSLTILAFIFALISTCYAAPNKDLYELQERCSKRTAEVFHTDENNITNTDKGQSITGYENHFSETFNKCFAREAITNFNRKSSKSPSNLFYGVWDVNESKLMASILKLLQDDKVITCFVNGKKCHSEDEFNELIKPYMEQ